MKTRRVISLTMSLAFIVMVYTGLMLFLCPHGRVAYWTGWSLLGLDKEQYGQLHTTFMVVFIVTGVWHIVLNWTPIVLYLKNRAKEVRVFTPDFNLSLVITVAFVVGTLAGWSPWSNFLAFEESVKDSWEVRDGSPPWGHAEENKLDRFVRGLVNWERMEHGRSVTLSVDTAVAALRGAGMDVEGPKQTVIDIADTNGVTPQVLMEIMRLAEVEVAGASSGALEETRPYPMLASGLGRMTLASYAEKYGIDVGAILDLLPQDRGIEAGMKLREVADVMGTDPAGVVEWLNGRD